MANSKKNTDEKAISVKKEIEATTQKKETAPKKVAVPVKKKEVVKAPKTADAKLKSLKVSPIKLAALARTIKGMPVNKAVAALTFSTKGAAKDVNKLLKSAMSNAENNFGLDIDKLYIKNVDVGKSMVLKRFTARGRGKSSKLLKPFSNIRIVVAEQEAIVRATKTKANKE
jgi:large subunit ribosomal protein L22